MTGSAEKRKKKHARPGHVQMVRDKLNRSVKSGFRIQGIPFYRSTVFLKQLAAVGVVVLLSALLLPDLQFLPSRYQVGSISPRNIKAPQDFDVPDSEATEEKRRQVREETLSVYDFDLSLVDTMQEDVKDAFAVMNRYYLGKKLRAEKKEALQKAAAAEKKKALQEAAAAEEKEALQEANAGEEKEALQEANAGENEVQDKTSSEEPQIPTEEELFQERHQTFQEIIELGLSDKALSAFEAVEFSPETANAVSTIVKTIMNKGVVGSPELLLKEADKGIVIKGVGEDFEKTIGDINTFLDLRSAREMIHDYSASMLDNMTQPTVEAVKEVASKLIVPNLTFNKTGTEVRKQQRAEAVKTVYFKVKKGEMIVREGEKIDGYHMAKLNALNVAQKESNLFTSFLGLIFFNSILLSIFLSYINRFKKSIGEDLQKLSLLALIIVASVGLIKAFYWISKVLMANLEFVEPTSLLYGIPFAFCGMLIGVLFEVRIFIFPILIVSILSGIMIHEDLNFILYALVGNVVAALTVQNCRRRTALLRGGIMVGAANIATALAIAMIHNELSIFRGIYDTIFAFFGGLLVSVLVSWVVPILESLFKLTTDIRLLELSDTNQRVLKDLLVHAPGTYQHALMVGNLSEEAAEAVGANPLLARVSAMYHDIGKIQKAEYFVENQINLANRHDKLAPSMSALILISHVKDGVELARKQKLPPAILSIIKQHHGTSLITFFYQKAKENEDPTIHEIKEADYRYPGPKPQSKEAAIVMITDAIEAASRVLNNPNPSRIEMMVNKILERIYIDGQLDECDLTLKDLRKIKKSLLPILNSIYHHRIDYPSVKLAEDEKRTQKDENLAQPAWVEGKNSARPDEIGVDKNLRNRQ
jgi:putative nucleotidyltransferase with HDIG domain